MNLFLLLLQVMMMVLPLLIIVLLPKVVNTNDPEMRKVGILFFYGSVLSLGLSYFYLISLNTTV